ncbi:MAG: GldG family protein [Oscillospiraceae bacterium]|nr:GldG family protein [Oscillospiraceae bacterium]
MEKKSLSQRVKSSFRSRAFRVGGYSVVSFLILAAIAVVVNVVVNALPATYTQFDTTSTEMFTISEQTEEILDALDDDIEIYWVVQSGEEDDTLSTLLDRYSVLSNHISVTKIDPDVYPTFIDSYVTADTQVYNNSLVVVSSSRYYYVSYEHIYEYQYDFSSYYSDGSYSVDVSFAGESCLTGAIDYVTSEDLPTVYTLTGHGETALDSDMQTTIERQNFALAELNLMTSGSVPEDADCLLIYSPTSDISDTEYEAIYNYLLSGGKMFLIYGNTASGSFSNLDALMSYYGVSSVGGLVIEGNSSNYAYGYPYYLMPSLESHDITDPLISSGVYLLLPDSDGIVIDEDLRDGLTVTELFTTSDAAYARDLSVSAATSYAKSDGDIDGPFALGVAIEDSETGAEIVWVSCAHLIDVGYGGGEDVFINALGWMCEHTSSISIHSKSIGTDVLTISSSTASVLTAIIVAILPAGCLVLGLYTWARRRKV